MEISCPVSLGEVLDKISILRIKLRRIADPAKLQHVRRELEKLSAAAGSVDRYQSFLADLEKVNEQLWDIEDAIRGKERKQQFDDEFIKLARSVYFTNDKRFEIKNAVNQQFG